MLALNVYMVHYCFSPGIIVTDIHKRGGLSDDKYSQVNIYIWTLERISIDCYNDKCPALFFLLLIIFSNSIKKSNLWIYLIYLENVVVVGN